MSNGWFHVFRRVPAARKRLYCFPYAGGSVFAFRHLSNSIHPNVELCVASLPGRGPRQAEPAESDLRRLVSALADAVQEAAGARFAFFGHSMGAMLCFEVARELRRRGSAMPESMVVSGARAPERFGKREGDYRHDLPRVEFLDYLRSLEGTPPEVFDVPELMDLLLPALRADFAISETYRCAAEAPLPASLIVLVGSDDPDVRPEDVAGWKAHAQYGCSMRSLPGGHFFIDRHWPEIGRLLDRLLNAAPAVRADGRDATS